MVELETSQLDISRPKRFISHNLLFIKIFIDQNFLIQRIMNNAVIFEFISTPLWLKQRKQLDWEHGSYQRSILLQSHYMLSCISMYIYVYKCNNMCIMSRILVKCRAAVHWCETADWCLRPGLSGRITTSILSAFSMCRSQHNIIWLALLRSIDRLKYI